MVAGTGYFNFSDIYVIDNIVRHVGITHGRALIIDHLRDTFSRDREYRYLTDKFGYPKIPNHKGLATNAGIEDDTTSRISIEAFFTYRTSYLPSISVRQTSSSYKPISFNQNRFTIDYDIVRTEDGYGNVDLTKLPARFIYAGAWDQTYEIKVSSNSMEDTSSIADLVMMALQANPARDSLERNGLFVKQVTSSGENSENTNNNDPMFTVSITANCYAEWRKEIPISNLLERIHFCFTIDSSPNDIPANEAAIVVNLD